MGRALALIAIIAVANANTCSNKAHAKFWPNWVSGSSTKFINSNSIECEFAKCPPLFLHRSGCNKIAIAYNPNMAVGTSNFTFRSQSQPDIQRKNFLTDVYAPIINTFSILGQSLDNFGPVDHTTAASKLSNLESGDVLVYVANEYQASGLNSICSNLVEKGIVVLPVFVGTDASISQLTLLADTQQTGGLTAELTKSGSAFTTSGATGLILPAVDHSEGISGNIAKRRTEAIVMFARLFAQCPGSCLSTCISKNDKSQFAQLKVDFPEPPLGAPGCCGPIGPPGSVGVSGNQGGAGCMGEPGQPGNDGLDGPQGEPGQCGIPGAPGQIGEKGQIGDAGVNGANGPEGQCGDPGKFGQPGAEGLSGNKGIPGDIGPPGPCGPNGSGGVVGTSGPPGDQGVAGIDGIGMIASEDGHNDAREAIFTRALLEIMQDQSMWKRIYDMENETNSFTNNILPINSCSCDT